MSSEDDVHGLGGIKGDELADAGRSGVTEVVDGDPVAWDPEWHVKFVQWSTDPCGTGPVFLLFPDHPSTLGDERSYARTYFLGCQETRPAPGAFLVGRTLLSTGWRIGNSNLDYQAICTQIEEEGLGHVSALVIGLKKNELVYLPNGISDPDQGVNLPIGTEGSPFDDEILKRVLDEFASDDQINAQDIRPALWEDPKKYFPTELAEQAIQRLLLIALRNRFLVPSYGIASETNTTVGRADVVIRAGSGRAGGPAVLELKASRQFHSSGTPVSPAEQRSHLLDGVQQAKQYAAKIFAPITYLCTYDMRKVKDRALPDAIRAECAMHSVRYRCDPVYASSKEVREAAASVDGT